MQRGSHPEGFPASLAMDEAVFPFKSNQDYNVLFAEKDGTAAAQFKAFEDTWEWNQDFAVLYEQLVKSVGSDASVPTFPGPERYARVPDDDGPRLVELRRVLNATGRMYLHCDPTSSHYLKVLLDAVFEPQDFRAEITWRRTGTHSDAKRWSPVADTILHYSKTDEYIWNPLHMPHNENYLEQKYRYYEQDGRGYRLDNMISPKPRSNMMMSGRATLHHHLEWRFSPETMAKLDAAGRIWYPDSKQKRPRLKKYLEKMSGVLMGNIWTDIDPINSRAAERLGYPTQKPEALLEGLSLLAATKAIGFLTLCEGAALRSL